MKEHTSQRTSCAQNLELHHIGYACSDIHQALNFIKKSFPIKKISEIVYDKLQKASLCLINLEHGPAIELVSGEAVKDLVKTGISVYHTCYEVEDIQKSLNQFKEEGGAQATEIYPATLFNNRKVVFLHTALGLIELLEKEIIVSDNLQRIMITGTFSTERIQAHLSTLLKEATLPYYLSNLINGDINLELANENSNFYKEKGINVIFMRCEDFFSTKNSDFKLDTFINCLKNFDNYPELKLIIYICPSKEIDIVSKHFSKKLKNEFKKTKHIVVNELSYKNEKDYIFDELTNQEAELPYTEAFDYKLAKDTLKSICQLMPFEYKAVIVDCDNTLWTGVCSEDSAENLIINTKNLLLQKYLINLQKNGIVIILCSKNDDESVKNVFQKNSNMLLKEKHIAAWQVNWNKKYENIKSLSLALNLPLRSFIFIDDDEIECEEVNIYLSEVLTINFKNEFKKLNFILETLHASLKSNYKESSTRTSWYQSHIKRENEKTSSTSLKSYIDSLHLVSKISLIKNNDMNRVSELSYRVNQFNFSNKRFTENQLKLYQAKGFYIFKVELSDKYGDYGIVGAIIAEAHENIFLVHALLLSCRALNRGIEHDMVAFLGKFSSSLNISDIIFEFINTNKNTPAKYFLEHIDKLYKLKYINNYQYAVSSALAEKIKFDPEQENKSLSTHEKKTAIPLGDVKYVNKVDLSRIYETIISSKNHLGHPENEISLPKPKDNFTILKLIWAEVLGCNIANNANFIDLGGNSLLALRLLSKIYSAFSIEVKIYDIFKNPNIDIFYKECIESRMSLRNSELTSILDTIQYNDISTPEEMHIDLSSSQKSLWLIDKLFENSWFYNISTTYVLKGNLCLKSLNNALQLIIDTNDILRSFIKYVGNAPTLAIKNKAIIPNLDIINAESMDDSDIDLLINKIQLEPFKLDEYPLYRFRLLKLHKNKHIFVIVLHHIIFDGWSESVFNIKLSEYYKNFLTNTPIKSIRSTSYADFIEWEKSVLSSQKYYSSLDYWKNELKNISLTSLPTTFPRAPQKLHHGNFIPFSIEKSLFVSLNTVSHDLNVTLFCMLYAAFCLSIYKINNQGEVIAGVPFSGRIEKEFENTLGNFVSTVALKVNIDTNLTVSSFIKFVQEKIFNAYEHQFVPIHDVVKNIPGSRNEFLSPLYQIMFAFQDADNQQLRLDGLSIEFYKKGYDAARMDLTLEVRKINENIEGGIFYDTALFDKRYIENFINIYTNMLLAISKKGNYYNLLNNILLQSYTTELTPRLLINNFLQCSIKFPNKIAVKYKNTSLSYKLLNAKSSQLATYLLSKQIDDKSRVILHLSKSADIIICILACFKIGAIYIPLDPEYPDKYKQYIIKDCEPNALLTNCEINQNLFENIFVLPVISEELDKIKTNIEFPIQTSQSQIAYIMYTSGTTGKPKGVIIKQPSLAYQIDSLKKLYNISEHDTGLLFHSFCFDVSVWEMWSVLASGGTLNIINHSREYSRQEFWKIICDEKITILCQTPTVFKNITDNIDFSLLKNISLRLLIFAGEALYPSLLLPWFKFFGEERIEFYNMYGVTEASIYNTYQRIDMKLSKKNECLIGKAIDGNLVEIFDENLNATNANDVGEIYISGSCLAEGYLNNPERNASSFIFINHVKWYRTGDLGRKIDKNIEYISRKDSENKIRGHRISPNYINTVIEEIPYISQAVTWISQNTDHHKKLCSAIVLKKKYLSPINNYSKLIAKEPYLNQNTHILPNGMRILHHRLQETTLQYQEIFIDNEYFKNDIEINDGDVILDVGANIGMFSLAASTMSDKIKIYAVEPVPELFKLLQNNLSMYEIDATCFNIGISDVSEQSSFTYYPFASVLSGKNTNISEVKKLVSNSISKEIDDKSSNEIMNAITLEEKINCSYLSMSDFIKNQGITKIDLLKIDVEQSELNVLLGIKEQDWSIINQVVVEAHNLNDNQTSIERYLKDKGFTVKVSKPNLLKNTDIVMLYAKKKNYKFERKSENTMNAGNTRYFSNKNDVSLYTKSILGEQLPAYMVPSHINLIDNFPMNANGKIDINILEKSIMLSTDDIVDHKKSKENLTLQATRVQEIWEVILKKKINNFDVNFFDVGGDSFLLVQLHNELTRDISSNVSLLDLFQHTSIKKQALLFDNLKQIE